MSGVSASDALCFRPALHATELPRVHHGNSRLPPLTPLRSASPAIHVRDGRLIKVHVV